MIIDINSEKQTMTKSLLKKQQILEMTKAENVSQLQQIQELREVERSNNVLKQQIVGIKQNLKRVEADLRQSKAINEQIEYHKNQLTLKMQKIHRDGHFPSGFVD